MITGNKSMGESRPQQVICYEARDEARTLYLEERRTGEDLQLAYQLL